MPRIFPQETCVTFSIRNRDTIYMKLCGFLILLSVAMMFLNFNQSYAQTTSLNFTSNATTSAGVFQDFYTHGNNLFDQGKYEEAISNYDKALAINSTNINLLYNKALALDKLGRLDEAISYYDKVLAIAPNDTDTLYNKGVDLDSLGKYPEAIAYYNKTLTITPNDTDTLNNLGLDLNILGKHNEAISYYDKVLAILPNDTDTLYNKGVALDNLGKHNEAISYYDKVLAIDPANVDALNKMNLTYNNMNKTEIGALQHLDQTSFVVVVGLFFSLLVAIIILDLVAKRAKRLNLKISQTSNQKNEEDENKRTKNQDEETKI